MFYSPLVYNVLVDNESVLQYREMESPSHYEVYMLWHWGNQGYTKQNRIEQKRSHQT